MPSKMIAERPSQSRKRAQIQRHRQKFWWGSNDIDRSQHIVDCDFCYRWIMRQIENSAVVYIESGWTIR